MRANDFSGKMTFGPYIGMKCAPAFFPLATYKKVKTMIWVRKYNGTESLIDYASRPHFTNYVIKILSSLKAFLQRINELLETYTFQPPELTSCMCSI
jgi:hypothetical protein